VLLLIHQKKNPACAGLFLNSELVAVLTASESASIASAEALAARAVALLAVYSAEGSVIALGRLEGKLLDFCSAFGACEAEFGNIEELPLRTILIVHLWFA